MTLVQQYGKTNWPIITKRLNEMFPHHEKTEKECKNKYKTISRQNSLNNWNIEEEFLFFNIQSIVGNKWNKIIQLFPNKSYLELKNHYYSSISKSIRNILNNKKNKTFKDKVQSFYSLKIIQNRMNINQNEKETIIEKSTSLESLSQNSSDLEFNINKQITPEKVKRYSYDLISDISQSFEISSIVPYVIQNFSKSNMVSIIEKSITVYIKMLLLRKCLEMEAMKMNIETESKTIVTQFINENNDLGLILSSSLKSKNRIDDRI